MPFLRRRGIMASESDMRRHNSNISNNTPLPEAFPNSSKQQIASLPLPSSPSSSSVAPNAETSPPAPSFPPSQSPADPASSFSTPPTSVTPATTASPGANNISPPPSGLSQTGVSRAPTIELPNRTQFPPPVQDESTKYRRFSMLKFRNASDSQLSARAKQQAQAAQKPPPLPQPPDMIVTAPTMEVNASQKKPSRMRLLPFGNREAREDLNGSSSQAMATSKKDRRKTITANLQPSTSVRHAVSFDGPIRPGQAHQPQPPAYGDGNDGSTLALPVNRLSESSRSDGSSGDRVYGTTTTTTHTVHTTTTFFRLPRRKAKKPEPLFPIAHLQKTSATPHPVSQLRDSTSSFSGSMAGSSRPSISSSMAGRNQTPTPSRPTSGNDSPNTGPISGLSPHHRSSVSPATALFRPSSRNSGQPSPTRVALHRRGRSSTMSSLGRNSTDDRLGVPTSRTSTSTGRKSFGDLLGLSRLRQNSEMSGRQGTLTPATPGSNTSKNNSIQLARDTVILPERRDDDTPAKYLARLEEVVSRSVIASALSKSPDTFSQAVLRSYMRGFSFFGDPMDMSIRKLLMEAELPKETQQIDRCLQAFANRYHECNPGIYLGPDQAYFIAFSLLILHTDVFNKNNKHKMQKVDYLRNTHGEGIDDPILECFYDNITYTPFIHVEDDLDINGERIVVHKAKKKSTFLAGNSDPVKKAAKEPIDPYTLILDNKLDILRPNLKDVMPLEDTYHYLGTAKSLNLQELQKTFFRTGVLQIVSPRSRPDAFMSEKTATNPEEAHPGIVDIKITKVGLLWRKDIKKKKTRSPWQEWGAILTGAQLYFFRNTAWIKSLMHQYEMHIKHGHDGIPVIFQPPLEHFKPDALMSTDGAVALVDSSYKKHKNAFVYVRHHGTEEVLLADNEEELNDWLAKLNYAAAFRTSGVRMRGVVGSSYDGQGRRAIRRLASDTEAQSVQTPSGEVTISRSKIDQKMVQDILEARREIMAQRIEHANQRIQAEEAKLEDQLQNARHLQILAPIQPKTREQMLLAAARMAAKLKWARMEMWRLKCHRDILLMDLEEERQQLGLPPSTSLGSGVGVAAGTGHTPGVGSPAPDKPTTIGHEDLKASSPNLVHPSPTPSEAHVIPRVPAQVAEETDDSSPASDVFQTPPTSATAPPSRHRHQNSWELPSLGFDRVSPRKASVSSAMSSGSKSAVSPPRRAARSSSASGPGPGATPAEGESKIQEAIPQGPGLDIDAVERDLLEQAGLLEARLAKAHDSASSPAPVGLPESEDSRDRRESQPHGAAASSSDNVNKHDRSKIRRSLQRTLRESAGHLSHHRGSRKGKEPSSSSHGGSHISADDEASRVDNVTTDVLSRGSGSFVVHGKKASVINFGGDLQGIAPDERLRQRKAQQTGSPMPAPTATGIGGGATDGENGSVADYQTVLQSSRDAERRESAASAGTATARSFRELHRKYSSAHQHAVAASKSGGSLSLPFDEDSDAAISFSDGWRTPLPPIEHEPESESSSCSINERSDDEEGHGEMNEESFLSRPDSEGPREPSSPRLLSPESRASSRLGSASGDGHSKTMKDPEPPPVGQHGGDGEGQQQLPSPPPIQVVTA